MYFCSDVYTSEPHLVTFTDSFTTDTKERCQNYVS